MFDGFGWYNMAIHRFRQKTTIRMVRIKTFSPNRFVHRLLKGYLLQKVYSNSWLNESKTERAVLINYQMIGLASIPLIGIANVHYSRVAEYSGVSRTFKVFEYMCCIISAIVKMIA